MHRTLIAATFVAATFAAPAFSQSLLGDGSNQRGNNGSLLGGSGSSYGGSYGSHQNNGYTNNRGTYVQPYQQTNPNGTQYDNYGSKGNYNPNTGRQGTRTPKY